jgi:hypothetical protein
MFGADCGASMLCATFHGSTRVERDIWTLIRAALRRLPLTWRRNDAYGDTQVLAVLLWAVLHDRPVIWACLRRNWPMQA